MNKLNLLCGYVRWFTAIAVVSFLGVVTPAYAELEQPVIKYVYVEGSDVVVVVQVPAGITKVTLESRSRLDTGSWAPVDVARLSGEGGEITFRTPMSSKMELLRVRADAKDALPAFFYEGTNSFKGAPSSSGDINELVRNAPLFDAGAPTAGDEKSREVVESDIWKIRGSTLYFFNQYRGLQIIDLTLPDAPVVLGTLSLPAAGEQMYVLDDNYVVLLARENCGWWGNNGPESAVLIVKIVDGKPGIIARLGVPGDIQESRLVGTALYVASGAYRAVTEDKTNGAWEWGTQVASFDLANPEAPAAKGQLWYSGYGNVVTATDQYLFVASIDTSNWNQSVIRCIDISAPDGTMIPQGTILPVGQVKDKFKMNLAGNVFTVITEKWNDTRRWLTILETYSLADPAAPKKLGGLQLAQGERLFATRFDGDRVYIVTFFQVDPLWVVDLSDPTAPQIKGELEVPGWSTYIQPLGDRLVAIGIDNIGGRKVAVSLFDVQDPAKPALVSKVPLGENYSWSEANSDEKALSVLPAAGLILVPYQGYATNGYASRVQLIDLDLDDPTENALKARGVIEHQFQPRRATMVQNTILSISGKELLSVDATDRDNPVVNSETELAWAVNRVFLQGEYLIEVNDGTSWNWGWNQTVQPDVRVTTADDPGTVLSQLTITNNLPVIGGVVKNGNLYLAQGSSTWYGPMPLAEKGTDEGNSNTNPPTLALSVFDLSGLPEIRQVGNVRLALTNFYGSSVNVIWPNPNLLVLSSEGGGWWRGLYLDVGIAADASVRMASSVMPWYWSGSGGRLLAFDVGDPANPKLASDVDLATRTTNYWWSFSKPYTADGLVYISHQATEFIEGVKSPFQTSRTVIYDETTGKYIEKLQVGVWVQRYFLDVVDYSDPKTPTARKPVNIPGTLQGLGYGGALVYTIGNHWAADWTTDWSEWLDACAYDGVSASLVDSLALPKEWPHPTLVHGGNVIIGRPDNTNNNQSSIETWKLTEVGKFTRLGSLFQDTPASTMIAIGNLLAVQNNNGTYKLLDATDPAKLVRVGQGSVSGCAWGDLTRANGSLERGLWLPLNDYGVQIIPRD